MLRLGWIADYFSRPVLIGYIHGVAIILVISQLEKLLGLSIDASNPLPTLEELAQEISHVSGATMLVAPCRSAILLTLRFTLPRCRGR